VIVQIVKMRLIVKEVMMVALMAEKAVKRVLLMIALVMVIVVQKHGLVMDCLIVRIPTIMVVI
jgi:hypothetical protein